MEIAFLQKQFFDCHSFQNVKVIQSCFCQLQKWEFSDLSSPFWRWYHNSNDGAYIIHKGKRIELIPGRVLLIPPYTVFDTGTTRPVRQLYMHFAIESRRKPNSQQIYFHHGSDGENGTMKRLVASLKHAVNSERLDIAFLSQVLVNSALAEIPVEDWGKHLPDFRIEEAIRIIHREAPHSLGNDLLARRVGMNVNAFTKTFRNVTGLTPHQFLMQLRMELAYQLLQSGSDSVETIAEKTGFYDRFHFSRTFKRHFHIGPSSFRRRALWNPAIFDRPGPVNVTA